MTLNFINWIEVSLLYRLHWAPPFPSLWTMAKLVFSDWMAYVITRHHANLYNNGLTDLTLKCRGLDWGLSVFSFAFSHFIFFFHFKKRNGIRKQNVKKANTLKKMKLTLSTCYLENINSRYVKKSNLQILLIRYAFLSL